jgi:hypothetical protein
MHRIDRQVAASLPLDCSYVLFIALIFLLIFCRKPLHRQNTIILIEKSKLENLWGKYLREKFSLDANSFRATPAVTYIDLGSNFPPQTISMKA